MRILTAFILICLSWLLYGAVTLTPPPNKPMTCIKDNEMFYLDDYEIEYNYVIDNTKRAVYTDCYFYDLKMAGKIKESMTRP